MTASPRDAAVDRLLAAWAAGDDAFQAAVDHLLSRRDHQAVLAAALARGAAAETDDFARALAYEMATLRLRAEGGLLHATLFAVPVLAFGGPPPAAAAIAAAFEARGLASPRGTAIIAPGLRDPDAVAALPLAACRGVIHALLDGAEPAALPGAAAPRDGDDHPMVVLGVSIEPVGEGWSDTLRGEAGPGAVAAFQLDVLRAGGLSDVARPCWLGEIEHVAADDSAWLVDGSGAGAEIEDYFAVAAAEAGQDRVACTLARTEDRYRVRLMTTGGRPLDDRSFSVWDLPMSPADFERRIAHLAAAVTWDAAAPERPAIQALPAPPRPLQASLRLVDAARPNPTG